MVLSTETFPSQAISQRMDESTHLPFTSTLCDTVPFLLHTEGFSLKPMSLDSC